jgi:hypothetical protein
LPEVKHQSPTSRRKAREAFDSLFLFMPPVPSLSSSNSSNPKKPRRVRSANNRRRDLRTAKASRARAASMRNEAQKAKYEQNRKQIIINARNMGFK